MVKNMKILCVVFPQTVTVLSLAGSSRTTCIARRRKRKYAFELGCTWAGHLFAARLPLPDCRGRAVTAYRSSPAPDVTEITARREMGSEASKDSFDKPWDLPASISSLQKGFFESKAPGDSVDPRTVENAFSSNGVGQNQLDALFDDGQAVTQAEHLDTPYHEPDQGAEASHIIATEQQVVGHEGQIGALHQTWGKQNEGEREHAEKGKSNMKGGPEYAMQRNSDGSWVQMTDAYGRPVVFPTDEVLKLKIEECGRVYRSQQVSRQIQYFSMLSRVLKI